MVEPGVSFGEIQLEDSSSGVLSLGGLPGHIGFIGLRPLGASLSEKAKVGSNIDIRLGG